MSTWLICMLGRRYNILAGTPKTVKMSVDFKNKEVDRLCMYWASCVKRHRKPSQVEYLACMVTWFCDKTTSAISLNQNPSNFPLFSNLSTFCCEAFSFKIQFGSVLSGLNPWKLEKLKTKEVTLAGPLLEWYAFLVL